MNPEQTDDRRKPMADELTVTQEELSTGMAVRRVNADGTVEAISADDFYVAPVTQEDRELIAALLEDLVAPSDPYETTEIRNGDADYTIWVQRAARHRLAQSKADAARIAALEEALWFYARPQSWRSSGVYMSGRSQATAAEIDGGERARAALEQTP